MVDSLRDQLLKCGITPPARESAPSRHSGRPGHSGKPGGGKPKAAAKAAANRPPRKPLSAREQEEIDLAKAYAIRAQTEARERRQAEREAAEQARIKRENKAKIQRLLADNALNKPDADQVRHFEYGGKIRRIYLDAAQLAALNAGELGVVQQAGRYVLVTREIAEQVGSIESRQLALLVDPGAAGGVGDDGVPDDLMW